MYFRNLLFKIYINYFLVLLNNNIDKTMVFYIHHHKYVRFYLDLKYYILLIHFALIKSLEDLIY